MIEALTDPFGAHRSAIVEHYRRVLPALLPHVGGTPLVAVLFPRGLEERPTYLGPLHHPPFDRAPTVDVESASGLLTYLAVAENTVLWQIHRSAVELHSWMPTIADPTRVRFARVLLEQPGCPDLKMIKAAALRWRALLEERGLDAAVGLDPDGATVWIPFGDAPRYVDVRAWLHARAAEVLARDPELFTELPDPSKVRIAVSSNAVSRWSALPYSLRGNAPLSVLTPVDWTTLADAAPATIDNLREIDSFDRAVRAASNQRFDVQLRRTFALTPEPLGSHAHVVDAMRQLLGDGAARSAEELCASGIANGLLAATTKVKYVENALRGLIDRQTLRGERPDFVELADGRFRLNVPLEPFPADHIALAPDPELDTLIDRLRASATRKIAPEPADEGNAGAPFERAVAAAFVRLGFLAVRDGKHGAPDVVAIAPLGATAYTIVIECKTLEGATPHVQWVAASEASRFRDRIGADYAMLIGPEFPGDKPLDDELQAHRVALWSVDDLIAVLESARWHPVSWTSLAPLFAAGRATQRVADFAFEHRHGSWQRARIALRYMLEEAAKYQASLAVEDAQIERTDARLTVESLTLLVNQRLASENAPARMSTADIAKAVEIAASPLYDSIAVDGPYVTVTNRAKPPI